MKVVLFSGGMGTRTREYSGSMPKPMVSIGYRPSRFCNFVIASHRPVWLALSLLPLCLQRNYSIGPGSGRLAVCQLGSELFADHGTVNSRKILLNRARLPDEYFAVIRRHLAVEPESGSE